MGLPKYIVNFDELTDDLKKKILEAINNEIKDKYPQLNTNSIEALLENLKELLPYEKYQSLKNKINDLLIKHIKSIQKLQGKMVNIPAIKGDYKGIFKFDNDILITGLHFNQTGWKKEDTWDLEINKNKIINGSTIKEIGEHKYFDNYYRVNAGVPISLILHNNSGNSRQTMVDLEYLKLFWKGYPVCASGIFLIPEGFGIETTDYYEQGGDFWENQDKTKTCPIAFSDNDNYCGGMLDFGEYNALGIKSFEEFDETTPKDYIEKNYDNFQKACAISLDNIVIREYVKVDFYTDNNLIFTYKASDKPIYIYSFIVNNALYSKTFNELKNKYKDKIDFKIENLSKINKIKITNIQL